MENRRLFYVAATRARDHLVLLGRPKPKEEAKPKGEADTWFQAVLGCPEAAALSRELILDPAEFPEFPPPGPGERAGPPDRGPDLLAPMTLAGAALSATELSLWLSGSSEIFDIYAEAGPSSGFDVHEEAETSRPPGALTPRETGLLFHAVMEILDPREPRPRELIAAEAARLGLAPGAAAALAGPIEAFLENSWGQAWLEAAGAGRAVFREWPFQLRIGESGGQARYLKVNGVIDLFFQAPGGGRQVTGGGRQAPGGGRIVDYKFAAFPGGSGEKGSRLPVYENQVRLYALALWSAGLAEDIRAALYFAGGDRPHLHEVDLDAGWTPEFWEKFFKKFFSGLQSSRLRL